MVVADSSMLDDAPCCARAGAPCRERHARALARRGPRSGAAHDMPRQTGWMLRPGGVRPQRSSLRAEASPPCFTIVSASNIDAAVAMPPSVCCAGAIPGGTSEGKSGVGVGNRGALGELHGVEFRF